ncbi:MAG: S-adenosylmethionine:tRNA ribosyltransferase-isomerase [Phycisphaerae bacterium]
MTDDRATPSESPGFATSELDYHLPDGMIAQHPPARRDDARLLVVDRAADRFDDARIVDLPERLRPGDLVVLNDTRVLPARFVARRRTGGAIDGLFVSEAAPGTWDVLLRGSKRLRAGETLSVAAEGDPVTLALVEHCGDGRWRVHVAPPEPVGAILERIGHTPLPPYIRRPSPDADGDAADRGRYQTVYAQAPGAIAAPTAGLHLTDELLRRFERQGVDTCFVTLHVGVGTFKPISAATPAGHAMHAERFEFGPGAAAAVNACRERGGRVVAVGTTTVRVLESAATTASSSVAGVPGAIDGTAATAGRTAAENAAAAERCTAAEARVPAAPSGPAQGPAGVGGGTAAGRPGLVLLPGCGTTDIFIYPPYRFRVADALLTNFHLPRSTLLALVMAFAGVSLTRRAYQHAISHGYRFYSYGDAMLIV